MSDSSTSPSLLLKIKNQDRDEKVGVIVANSSAVFGIIMGIIGAAAMLKTAASLDEKRAEQVVNEWIERLIVEGDSKQS